MQRDLDSSLGVLGRKVEVRLQLLFIFEMEHSFHYFVFSSSLFLLQSFSSFDMPNSRNHVLLLLSDTSLLTRHPNLKRGKLTRTHQKLRGTHQILTSTSLPPITLRF